MMSGRSGLERWYLAWRTPGINDAPGLGRAPSHVRSVAMGARLYPRVLPGLAALTGVSNGGHDQHVGFAVVEDSLWRYRPVALLACLPIPTGRPSEKLTLAIHCDAGLRD